MAGNSNLKSHAADELSRGPGGDAEDGEQAEGAEEAVVAVGHAVRIRLAIPT